jgi:general secretion pathway protein K
MMRRRRERGFALLVVLWTLGFLALVGTALVAAGRREMQRSRNLLDGAAAEAAADGAVQQAVFALLDTSPTRHWRADGAPHLIRSRDFVTELRLENENGKINPNFAPPEMMRALLVQLGTALPAAEKLSVAIADRRNQTNRTVQPDPDEKDGDQAPQGNTGPTAGFESLDDLAAIPGMTPALLARLKPHLTLFSVTDPDSFTTDKVIAAALGALARDAPGRNAEERTQVVQVTAVVRGPHGSGFAEKVVVRTNALDGIRRHEILSREFVPQG